MSANSLANSNPSVTCPALAAATKCLEIADCSQSFNFPLIAFETELSKLYSDNNCSKFEPVTNETTTDSPTPPPTEAPPIIDCEPQLLTLPNNSDAIVIEKLSPPVVAPSGSSVLCRQHYYPTLRHCSLFSYSHLRPFGSDQFQTCSLPGAWYLLKHQDVTIEVTGVSDDISSSFTKLQKVY